MTATASQHEYVNWLQTVRSAQRFGPADRRGTINYIDEAARRRAVAAVAVGRCVSVSRPVVPGGTQRGDDRVAFGMEKFHTPGPVALPDGRPFSVSSDHIELDCHGLNNTHIDALNHIGLHGTTYNGWPVGDDRAPDAADLSTSGIVTRGVYIDMSRYRSTGYIDPDSPIQAIEIDAELTRLGVDFHSGDALLLDCGRDVYEASGTRIKGRSSGPGASVGEWLVERQASVLCWDFLDAVHPDEPPVSIHLLNWAAGLVLVDNCDFTALRAAGAATGLLAISPLRIERATGSNVNPLFVF